MRRLQLPGIGLAAMAFALALAGCQTGSAPSTSQKTSGEGKEATGGEIKIGLVASESGDLKPWGADSVRGAQLAVKQYNESVGANGPKVQLLKEDSMSKPETGKSAAEKLVADGVMALIGEVASGITNQMANVAVANKLPLVAVGATRDDITAGGPNLFRVCYIDSFQGPVMAKFAYDDLGLRRVALVTDKKQPYSTGLSDNFRKAFEAMGGKIVIEEFYESDQTQFSGQLTNIKGASPDALFLSGYFTEVGSIVRQAAQLGMGNLKFLGGDGWDSVELQKYGGDAIIGGYFCNHYNNAEERPEVKTFLDAWKAEYGGLPSTTMGALGYDATALVLDAIKRVDGPVTKESLTAAIAETEGFQAVSGSITLKGKKGNPPKRALVVKVIKPTEANPTGQEFVKAYEHSDVFGSN